MSPRATARVACVAMAVFLMLGSTFFVAPSAHAGGFLSFTGMDVAQLAQSARGEGACSGNPAGGIGFASSCTGNGGRPEYWCSDFAKWVWAALGLPYTSELTPASASFYTYGQRHGTLSATPAVGDAVVFDYTTAGGYPYADHVAIVTQVNPDGTIESVSGDWNGQSGTEAQFAGTSSVMQNAPAYPGAVGSSSNVMGMTVSGYVAPVGLPSSVAAFQGHDGELWSIGTPSWTDWGLGMAQGSSPTVVGLPGGGYEFAFQASGGGLWTVGTVGWTNWGVGMASRTSPSVAILNAGGVEIAFQANGGRLWTVGAGGWTDWGVGIAPGTSPAIAALPRGGFEVAFQAAGGHLWTVGAGGWTDWGVGIAPGTSPAIAALSGGGFEVAFQAAGGRLWTVGTAGWTNWNLGMNTGSSPAMLALSGGGFEIAFEAAGGALWTVGPAGWKNWGGSAAPGTSPAITVQQGGWMLETFEGTDGRLWTVGPGEMPWSTTVAAGTSPGIR